ncbi:sporulation integral membrane protein YtvI [Clostridium cellulovorans]|uniref:Sporulation integral membrane protein YtvI n=1 Tax=Clostridium cellulovorans (strain ATCC 35296 / DSM 3052 / OCM 3 / 743B) TaxID=573061 RepID=D9SKZ7_CLOC7|nr:sporulation integral membrane protein YtvI [Clostridium cellulovorans]ADL53569.1 sporulation integral membrane protein YtvI [Clostridium cellulovorans 743B]
MDEKYTIDFTKLKKFLIVLILLFLGLFILFKSMYYLAPFVVALILSLMIEPFVKFLGDTLKLKRAISSAIGVLMVLSVFGGLLALIISKLVRELISLSDVLPDLIKNAYENIMAINSDSFFDKWLPKKISYDFSNITDTLYSSLSSFANPLAKGIFSTASALPNMFIFLIVMVIGTYFISSSKHDIINLINKHLPKTWLSSLNKSKDGVFSSLSRLLKGYLIILTITFIELLIGFNIIGVKYASALALIISVFDILPLIGSGLFLIPWAIYSVITGATTLGIRLFILYIVILIIRQLIEPKIIGAQIGLHPLATLISMYTGFSLLGGAGIFLGPIILLITKAVLSTIYRGLTFKEIFLKCESTDNKTKTQT